jgi:hypothetical protein
MNLLDKRDLCEVLSFCYRTMLASVPLLEFAIQRSAGELRDYYEQHVIEEQGHERMVADDLQRLGIAPIPTSHFAAQVAGSQYYLIAHEHPALLLGYMHALESQTMSVEVAKYLSKHHGTELTALLHHARHDPQHKVDLERVIFRTELELRDRIAWNEVNVLQLLNRRPLCPMN